MIGRSIGALLVSIFCFHAPAPANAEPLAPLVRGWEQFFTTDWRVSERRHRPVMTGHVVNAWGVPATRVQLLVEGVAVIWLGKPLPPGSPGPLPVALSGPPAGHPRSGFAVDRRLNPSLQTPLRAK